MSKRASVLLKSTDFKTRFGGLGEEDLYCMELPNQEQTTSILWGRGLARYLILTNSLHITKAGPEQSPNSPVNCIGEKLTQLNRKWQPSVLNNSWIDCYQVLEYNLSLTNGSQTQVQRQYQTNAWKIMQFQAWSLSRDSPSPQDQHEGTCFHGVKCRWKTVQSNRLWADDTS